MKWRWIGFAALAAAVGTVCLAVATHHGQTTLALAGIVTTDDVVVSPRVAGCLARLHVREGESVKRGQLLAEIEPDELAAQRAYYSQAAQATSAQVEEVGASLRFQEKEAAAKIRQAAAAVAALEGERSATFAQLEDARGTWTRQERLAQSGAVTDQELDHARRAFEAAQARVEALDRQIDGQRATLELARASVEETAARRAAVLTAQRQHAAAAAQAETAEVKLGYTRLLSPIDGVVDVRAAREGEFVSTGQPVVTLVNPDDLWVRTDVEESYVDQIRLGDRLRIRLPSGAERDGTVFFRGVDAGFATRRDVSRSKRDIRTFEVRLRVGNEDRRLALGSTATVLLPVER